MKGWVINSDVLGVFLGSVDCGDEPYIQTYWSLSEGIGAVGVFGAVGYPSKDQAQRLLVGLVRGAEIMGIDPCLHLVEVELDILVDGDWYVTAGSCVEAGLEGWDNGMTGIPLSMFGLPLN